MIKHIIKLIWTDRRTNIWILLELILVFSILWFCTDYLFHMTKRYFEPRGFDIEHTYSVGINMKDEGRKVINAGTDEEKQAMLDDLWTIHDRVKQYSAIENVSFSLAASPYSGAYASRDFFIDSVESYAQIKRVSYGYFDVFKVKIISGTPFNDENTISDKAIIISGNRDNMFGPRPVEQVKEIRYSDDNIQKVIGIANKMKENDYKDYSQISYSPIKRDSKSIKDYREMCIRVKPEADKNFIEQFKKDMRNRLEIGHYFLASVTPMEKMREDYMNWNDYSGNFKSIYSISSFLIVNIFLGIIGTFWFRTQSRREEIGLRIAMGASKKSIKGMLIGETLFMLFFASIIATVICINITMVDILKDIGVPTIDRSNEKISIAQYFINYGITFIFLAIVAIIAVWYPSKKASNIQPAEALRDQ